MSECKNLTIFKKDTKTYELKFKKNGAGIDITDWTIYFTVKEKMEDSDLEAIIKKDISAHSDPSNGVTTISLTSEDTDYTGNYYYSIDYKDGDGNEGVLFHGRIKFQESVRDTRS